MEEFSAWFFSAQGAVALIVFVMLILTIISVVEIKRGHKS